MSPSINDIAKITNLSKSTISRALRNSDLISPETTSKVLSAAFSIGYVPGQWAAFGSTATQVEIRNTGKRRNLVNVIFYKLNKKQITSFEYFNMLSSALHEAFNSVGITIMEAFPQSEKEYLNILENTMADATIILSNIDLIDINFIQKLKLNALTRPLILLSNYISGHEQEFNCVRADNVSMGSHGTQYLLNNGVQNIFFVDPMRKMAIFDDRYLGYRRTMEEAGLTPKRICFDLAAYISGKPCGLETDFNLPEGKVGLLLGSDALFKQFPTYLCDHGIMRPDLLIVGMDGYPQLSLNDFRQATVTVDFEAMARATVRLLDDILEKRVSTPQQIIIGTSTVSRQ